MNGLIRKEKVAMLHPGRCGSTVLGSLMNQHPDMYWWGEPFERLMKKGRALTTGEVIDTIKNAEQAKISKIFSFATKHPKDMHLSADCINMDINSYIDLLDRLGYKKFIVIERSNHLKRAVSMEVGRQSKEWHSMQEAKEARKVSLDPASFEVGINIFTSLKEYFESLDKESVETQRALEGKRVLNITYEEDIEADPTVAYKKVCQFLGVTPGAPEVKLKKTNPFPVKDMLTNFHEVEKALQGTRYAWMLSS